MHFGVRQDSARPGGQVVELQPTDAYEHSAHFSRRTTGSQRAVRFLAWLLFATCLFTLGGMAYALWDGRLVTTDRMVVQTLLAVPGMLWFLRILWHCARYATVRETEYAYWPFASQGVMSAYFVLAAPYWYLS
jgi:hypothetical protein